MKIAILGYSGAGKSTLAKQLGTFYNIPVLHLDTVQFLSGWQERDRQEAVSIVSAFMKNNDWVIDGNYTGFLQKQRLEEADQIIFLDFPRCICFWSAFLRYLTNRNKTRSDMAEGCIEKFDLEFVKWILLDGRSKSIRCHYRTITKAYSNKIKIFHSRKSVTLFMKKLEGTH